MAAATQQDALPRNLVKLLPEDPYEQLDLARKITCLALSTRVSALEARMGQLRHKLEESDGVIDDLQSRIAEADQATQKTNIRILKTTDEQMKLSKENEELQETIFKLRHDVSKLELFRRSLVQTLRLDHTMLEAVEEELSPVQAATVGKSNDSPRSPPSAPVKDTVKDSYVQAEDDDFHSNKSAPADDDEESTQRALLFQRRQSRRSTSDLFDARRGATPLRIPKSTTAKVSPPKQQEAFEATRVAPRPRTLHKTVSAGPSSPPALRTSSPVASHSARLSDSDLAPLVRHEYATTAPNSPPRPSRSSTATPPRSQSMQMLNGREFFRQAKDRLSLEQFRTLLNTIKDLNSHKLTREEALEKAEEIFGEDNRMLYVFLTQHLPS